MHAIIENIPDMIFVKDADNLRYVQFNRAGEELLGYSRQELLGKSDYDLFPQEEAEGYTMKDREALSSCHGVEIPEETIKTWHKGQRILATKKIPIFDDTGHPRYLLGVSEDITEKVNLRQKEKDWKHSCASFERWRLSAPSPEESPTISTTFSRPFSAIRKW